MNNDLLRQLGERVRELRRAQGWSQEDAADSIGLHRTYLGHIETGRKDLRLSSIQRIANTFGIPLSELFAGIEQGEPSRLVTGKRPGLDRERLRSRVAAVERTVQQLRELLNEPVSTDSVGTDVARRKRPKARTVVASPLREKR